MLPVVFSMNVFCTGNRLLCCTTHHVLLCCACIPTQRIMKAGLVVCDWHLAEQTRSIVQKKCSANLIPSNQHRKEVVISSRPRIEQGHISWRNVYGLIDRAPASRSSIHHCTPIMEGCTDDLVKILTDLTTLAGIWLWNFPAQDCRS
jgi:hypothetical protein